MDHSLTDSVPEIVGVLLRMEDILKLGSSDGGHADEETRTDHGRDARRILADFRFIHWHGGIRIAFARNSRLASLLNLPIGLVPEMLALLGSEAAESEIATERSAEKFSMESLFSVLVHCPDVVGGTQSKAKALK